MIIFYLYIITLYGSKAHIYNYTNTQELKKKAKMSKVAHELLFNRCGK